MPARYRGRGTRTASWLGAASGEGRRGADAPAHGESIDAFDGTARHVGRRLEPWTSVIRRHSGVEIPPGHTATEGQQGQPDGEAVEYPAASGLHTDDHDALNSGRRATREPTARDASRDGRDAPSALQQVLLDMRHLVHWNSAARQSGERLFIQTAVSASAHHCTDRYA